MKKGREEERKRERERERRREREREGERGREGRRGKRSVRVRECVRVYAWVQVRVCGSAGASLCYVRVLCHARMDVGVLCSPSLALSTP